MKSARVSRNLGALAEHQNLAASRRLPVAGKIRPGIKVPTAKAAQIPGLVERYTALTAEGHAFDSIANMLKNEIKGCPGYPLAPRNAAYFSVRQCDFTTAGAAQAIMDRYGEVRPGDPEKRLYAFPVIFPSDDLDLIFREQFEAWKASELHRWSEPDPNTGELMCMRRAQVAPDKSNRRRWGGRPLEAERLCDPNDCQLFAAGECKHVGTLNFWVPGVPGVGVVSMTFTSLYASMGVAEILDMVRMGLGRVSGLTPSGDPIFWISKRHERVSRMNWETGRPEKNHHWIIQLEASGLDMAKALSGHVALSAPESQTRVALAAPSVVSEHNQAALEYHPQPNQHEKAPSEPADPTMDPEVAKLRKELAYYATKHQGWSAAEFEKWVIDQAGSTAAAHQIDPLKAMVDKLKAMSTTPATEQATEPTAAPAQGELVTDEEAPF
jgi:hypothetical protein